MGRGKAGAVKRGNEDESGRNSFETDDALKKAQKEGPMKGGARDD